MVFAQVYPRFTRFECRTFLTEALQYFGGAAARMMIDNTSVLIARGSGKHAVVAPTMEAFARHYGFEVEAHEVGDANRSARVEGPFYWIENNFYAGRTFRDLVDCNGQMRDWCDYANARYSDKLRASRIELFAAERAALTPLPLHVPEVYDLHSRRVDTEGYVTLHTNRYSVPASRIGRRVDIHETLDRVRVYDGHEQLVEHDKAQPGQGKRTTHPEHRGRRKVAPPPPLPQESVLRATGEELAQLVDRLRERHGGRAARAVRVLHRIYLDYPTDVVRAAVREALKYGMCDLPRIERMILERTAGDFFRLPTDREDDDET